MKMGTGSLAFRLKGREIITFHKILLCNIKPSVPARALTFLKHLLFMEYYPMQAWKPATVVLYFFAQNMGLGVNMKDNAAELPPSKKTCITLDITGITQHQ